MMAGKPNEGREEIILGGLDIDHSLKEDLEGVQRSWRFHGRNSAGNFCFHEIYLEVKER